MDQNRRARILQKLAQASASLKPWNDARKLLPLMADPPASVAAAPSGAGPYTPVQTGVLRTPKPAVPPSPVLKYPSAPNQAPKPGHEYDNY